MKGEFFSNGYIRNLDTPIVDYVDSGYKYLFNKDEFVHNGNAKAEAAHSLLNQLMKSFLALLDKTSETDDKIVLPLLSEIECITMNITRLLNLMRPYQLRENLIRQLNQQIKDKQQMIKEIDEMISKVNHTLKEGMDLSADAALSADESFQNEIKSLLQETEKKEMEVE